MEPVDVNPLFGPSESSERLVDPTQNGPTCCALAADLLFRLRTAMSIWVESRLVS